MAWCAIQVSGLMLRAGRTLVLRCMGRLELRASEMQCALGLSQLSRLDAGISANQSLVP